MIRCFLAVPGLMLWSSLGGLEGLEVGEQRQLAKGAPTTTIITTDCLQQLEQLLVKPAAL